jgi:uncharacterized protein
MTFLIAAISLGFLGSFHCLGMCGPIALALPIGNLNTNNKIIGVFLYNFGRVLTYASFGIIFGAFGKTIALFGYQQLLSISLGIIILLGLLLPNTLLSKTKLHSTIYASLAKLKNALSKLFLKEGKKSLFFIGLLNGLLPCGMVYMAIAGAVASSDLFKGALFMVFFGLGTLPMMFLLPFAGNKISISLRNKIRKAVPVMIGLMAVILILRGLNLGIPYVSPEFNKTKEIPVCHSLSGKKVCIGSTKN